MLAARRASTKQAAHRVVEARYRASAEMSSATSRGGPATPVGDEGSHTARSAALVVGLPDNVAGVQMHRFCASASEGVNLAAHKVGAGSHQLLIAGGVRARSCLPTGSAGGAGSPVAKAATE